MLGNSFAGGADRNAKFNRVPVSLPVFTVATAPPAASNSYAVIGLSDGAAGSPCLAISDGTNWLRCDTLATAAATG